MGLLKSIAKWFNGIYTDDNPTNTLDFIKEDENPVEKSYSPSFERPPEGLKPPTDDELPVCEETGLKPIWDCQPCEYIELFTGNDGRAIRICTCKEKLRQWGCTEEDLASKQQCIRDAGILCYGFKKGKDGKPVLNERKRK